MEYLVVDFKDHHNADHDLHKGNTMLDTTYTVHTVSSQGILMRNAGKGLAIHQVMDHDNRSTHGRYPPGYGPRQSQYTRPQTAATSTTYQSSVIDRLSSLNLTPNQCAQLQALIQYTKTSTPATSNSQPAHPIALLSSASHPTGSPNLKHMF
ncbi:hypothetical protein LINPERPRIM_LOCUS22624 [Linum perenne]